MEKLETVEETTECGTPSDPQQAEDPEILEEICVEELAIDGICGVY